MSQEISEIHDKTAPSAKTNAKTNAKGGAKDSEKTIPGPIVVVGVAVFVVVFPVLAILLERYAKHVGDREGLRPGYSAYRDPQQWLLSWGIIAFCLLLGWGLGCALKKR